MLTLIQNYNIRFSIFSDTIENIYADYLCSFGELICTNDNRLIKIPG